MENVDMYVQSCVCVCEREVLMIESKICMLGK